MALRIVAEVTDFGEEDPYVGIMETVMLRINPDLRLIRLTQNIRPQNVASAAYVTAVTWPWLPQGAALLAVVDPGVGTGRRELIVRQGERWLVCPDNGIASLVLSLYPAALSYRAADVVLAALAERRPQGSVTFDGRDLFAPLAAMLTLESQPESRLLGEPVSPFLLPGLSPVRHSDGQVSAVVLHIDHFGNGITSIRREHLPTLQADGPTGTVRDRIEIALADRKICVPFGLTFSSVQVGEPIVYWGSSGFLEIGVRNGNAAVQLSLAAGTPIALSRCADR